QDLRVGVLEIKPELIFLVGGIERCGRARRRRGEERDDHRQPVWQRDADAIPPTDSSGGQRLRERFDLLTKIPVADADVRFRQDDRGIRGRDWPDQIEQGRGSGTHSLFTNVSYAGSVRKSSSPSDVATRSKSARASRNRPRSKRAAPTSSRTRENSS